MLQFRSIARHNPLEPEAPKKYYAVAVPTKKLSFRELVDEISFATAINGIAVSAVLEALIELIPKHLSDGKLIQLGDFGSFRLTISSNGVEIETDVKGEIIKGVRIVFTPGATMKTKLSKLKFEKMS